MAYLLIMLLSVVTLSVCIYGMAVFGVSLWPGLFSLAALFLLVSLFVTRLFEAAVVVARAMGVISLLAFLLLILAAMIGGAFHLSESNQIVAMALALMALFGCATFAVSSTRN